MLHPTAQELSKEEFNRYEIAMATAKCARMITDEYVRQHDAAEKAQTGNKETDRPINTLIDKDIRDEKAVQLAVERIYKGDYTIVRVKEEKTGKTAASESAVEENGAVAEKAD